MNFLYLMLQERWTGGWLEYSIYGIVVLGIAIFLLSKLTKAKDRKRRNERLREDDIEDRKKN
ncbi:hypothetical protein [Nonlabens antarcticus]|uniref:hypothetical protein n=1 Tax=Nonlabens antarcticus TaxID=392714 RepID=UPI001890CE37|nr:hypothetical protein [Nonlabens antarcticus]